MKIRILDASLECIERPFRKPLQISSGIIASATEARVCVRISAGSKEGYGWGSIYLSDLWAWPGPISERGRKEVEMRRLCEELASSLVKYCSDESAHPLELGMRLHHSVSRMDSDYQDMPLLARSVCASPFDAAIHDAAGKALQMSAFGFYSDQAPIPSVDSHFGSGGACEAIRRLLRPSGDLNGWWLVSSKDNLETDVRPAVARNGFRCFKIKILAKDNEADSARTSEIYRAARAWGIAAPMLSVDSNEGNPDPESVLDYLQKLEALDPEAYSALAYLEQPTGRDIEAHAFDWRATTIRKPVFLDEGLTSLELLPLAKEQGWSGLALKTCKGHSFAICAAAWAQENGMALTLQDLTNPGFSAIHSCLFAAHVPTLNGVELNSPQYTPAANEEWMPRLSGLFDPRNGCHSLPSTDAAGLGSSL